MSLSRQALVVAAAVVLSSCTSATEARAPRAVVEVTSVAVPAAVRGCCGVGSLAFVVPITVRNTGSAPFEIEYCASGVEVRRGTTWVQKWWPTCAMVATPGSRLVVAPGESRDYAFPVTAALRGDGPPDWGAPELDGRYRVILGVMASGVGGRIPQLPSGEFALVTVQ